MTVTEEERRPPDSRADAWGITFYAGVVSNLFSSLATILLHPLIVLPMFLAGVTDSLYIVALPPILLTVGRCVASPIGQLLANQPNRASWLIGTNALRAILVGLLALIASRSDDSPESRTTAAFLIALAAFALGDGLIRTMMATIRDRALPAPAQTLFVRLSRSVAGLVGLVGALIVARVLGEEGPGTPGNFALLFLVATISCAVTIFFAFRLRAPEPTTRSAYPHSGGTWVNRAFWRFAIFRLALGGAALIDPFLVLYAVQELSASASTIGWLIALFVIGQLLSWPLWTAVAHRSGARASFQLMAVARIIAAVVAFAVPELIQTQQWTDRIGSGQAAALLFGTSFFFVGITHAGLRAVEHDYVSRLVPTGSFPGVLPAPRFVAMVAALSPLLGAWIIERTGAFQDAFLVSGALSLVALLVSGLLRDALIRPRTVTAAPSVAGRSGSSEVQPGEQLQTRPSP